MIVACCLVSACCVTSRHLLLLRVSPLLQPFVTSVADIEHVHFERVIFGAKNFDMVIIYKVRIAPIDLTELLLRVTLSPSTVGLSSLPQFLPSRLLDDSYECVPLRVPSPVCAGRQPRQGRGRVPPHFLHPHGQPRDHQDVAGPGGGHREWLLVQQVQPQ